MTESAPTKDIISRILVLLQEGRNRVVSTINSTMVVTYFEIGRLIMEEEQNGRDRAGYGTKLLDEISERLVKEFGRGFSVTNLRQMRRFYSIYAIQQTASAEFKLSWSHYLKLMRITDPAERQFYEIEAFKNGWSIKELTRQYDSALFTRLALSKSKDEILELAKVGQTINNPKDIIKDPYVLEFLGLPESERYSESDLEQQLIDRLENFLLELGKGFTFVARQSRISFDEKHFKIDLVFYNRILKCFVLIDLKIGELKHQDIGQMQMYVNYYDREVRLPDENRTIGIILCQDKNESVVKYTLPEDNRQIFASKYLTVLPSKEDLKRIIEIASN